MGFCFYKKPFIIKGIKGAEAIAVCVWLARNGYSKTDIRAYVGINYYNLFFYLPDIREETYQWSSTCQDTVALAIECFLDSTDFEDAIRNAICVGGDSDTIAAMTGAIAEAFYGIPNHLRFIAKC